MGGVRLRVVVGVRVGTEGMMEEVEREVMLRRG